MAKKEEDWPKLSETDLLNRHGVFLKKAVMRTLGGDDRFRLIKEEMAYHANGFRGACDLVVRCERGMTHVSGPDRVNLYIECKRCRSDQKEWWFVGNDNHYATFRCSWDITREKRAQTGFPDVNEIVGMIAKAEYGKPDLCIEGFEYDASPDSNRKERQRLSADPVVDAANQLARHCAALRMIYGKAEVPRDSYFGLDGPVGLHHISVLVTTAPLKVVEWKPDQIDIESGRIEDVTLRPVEWLVLNHPFPGANPKADNRFVSTRGRNKWRQDQSEFNLTETESMWVVNSAAFGKFIEECVFDPEYYS